MSANLKRLDRVEVSLAFSRESNRWVSYWAHLTAHGPTRDLAEEAMRRELDLEERDAEQFIPPPASLQSIPRGAEIRLVTRRPRRMWAE